MRATPVWPQVRRLAALALGSLLVAGCAGMSPVAQPVPGQLLLASPDKLHGLPDAGRNWVMSYASTTFDGANAVVVGQVALPRTPAPAGGYPVIAWANGSTGLAPQCAPSLVVNRERDAYLNAWVQQGYAVVRTDYAGWGAFGPVPDLHSRSNAENLADAVAAAHALDGVKLRPDWIAVGHSKGGGAVLWAAGLPDRSAGRYPLRAAIAIAPTGPGVLRFMDSVMRGEAVAVPALPFVSLTVMSAKAMKPDLDVQGLTSPALRPHLEAMGSACLSGLFAMPPLPPGPYLKPGAAYDAMARLLAAQDASSLTMRVPVSVIQGEKDETTVTPDTTAAMVRSLCARGATVQLKQYAGQTHRSVIGASQSDTFGFARTVLDAGRPASDCP